MFNINDPQNLLIALGRGSGIVTLLFKVYPRILLQLYPRYWCRVQKKGTSQIFLTLTNYYKDLWRDTKYEEVGTYKLLIEFIIENEDRNDFEDDICLKIKHIGGIEVSLDLV